MKSRILIALVSGHTAAGGVLPRSAEEDFMRRSGTNHVRLQRAAQTSFAPCRLRFCPARAVQPISGILPHSQKGGAGEKYSR